jgi:hypothetical protein
MTAGKSRRVELEPWTMDVLSLPTAADADPKRSREGTD